MSIAAGRTYRVEVLIFVLIKMKDDDQALRFTDGCWFIPIGPNANRFWRGFSTDTLKVDLVKLDIETTGAYAYMPTFGAAIRQRFFFDAEPTEIESIVGAMDLDVGGVFSGRILELEVGETANVFEDPNPREGDDTDGPIGQYPEGPSQSRLFPAKPPVGSLNIDSDDYAKWVEFARTDFLLDRRG